MKFNSKQLEFLSKSYIGRFASCGRDLQTHVSPVYFANELESIFFATERTTRKFKDVSENRKASIVVDDFDADWLHGGKGTQTVERAICVIGVASIVESGSDYGLMRLKLFEKYPDYKEENWGEGIYPIIRLKPNNIVSWGL